MEMIGPSVDRTTDCEAILRSLPQWFGIERALLMYARDSSTMPTFALQDGSELMGFLTLREHFPEAWEVHCIAVRAASRRQGHGSQLLAHAEAWLVKRGVRFLQVKTVAATSTSKEYAETREFYRHRGFTPIEVFPTLWDAHNPALQSIKMLNAG
jgi:GNAT superfamily N-acetyltransferase